MPMVGIAAFCGDFAGELGRNPFQHHRECARLLQRGGVLEQAARGIRAPLPSRVPARDARPSDGPIAASSPIWPITGISTSTRRANGLGHRDAAFELHRLGAAFLDQAAGVAQRLLDAHLVGKKRHVGDEQGALARRARPSACGR